MDLAALAFPVLVGLIVVALAFDFLNGLHDAANSIATVVSTRVLRPQYAVAWAAFFNFIAFLFFGLHVAQTIGTGIVAANVVDARVILGALTGAIAWNLITWWGGIPSSSSHALVGGLLGAGIAKIGIGAIVWHGVIKTGAAIVLSPLTGFMLALLLVLIVSWAFVRFTPYAVDSTFRMLQFVSASLYSLGHGGNDAQKTMGIIAVLLFSQGMLGEKFHVLGGDHLPGRHGTRHADRRLAHREDDGLEDYPAHPVARILRRDRRRDHAVRRHLSRHSGLDHAHHHRRDHRGRRGAQALSGALERRWQHRDGLDRDDPGVGGDRGADLLGYGTVRLRRFRWR
jgi:hypothetical protein